MIRSWSACSCIMVMGRIDVSVGELTKQPFLKNVKEKETESNISRILQVVSCHVVYAKSLIYTKLI